MRMGNLHQGKMDRSELDNSIMCYKSGVPRQDPRQERLLSRATMTLERGIQILKNHRVKLRGPFI